MNSRRNFVLGSERRFNRRGSADPRARYQPVLSEIQRSRTKESVMGFEPADNK